MAYQSYTTGNVILQLEVGPDAKRVVRMSMQNMAELLGFIGREFADVYDQTNPSTDMRIRMDMAMDEWASYWGEPVYPDTWTVQGIVAKGTMVNDRYGNSRQVTWGVTLGTNNNGNIFGVAWEE